MRAAGIDASDTVQNAYGYGPFTGGWGSTPAPRRSAPK